MIGCILGGSLFFLVPPTQQVQGQGFKCDERLSLHVVTAAALPATSLESSHHVALALASAAAVSG
jgi:hypothetical protein